MSPIIVLISTIITIGIFSKSNELIVMRACGIGLARFALPMFIVAIIAAGIVFLDGEYLLPESNQEMERIMKVEIKKKELKGVQLKNDICFQKNKIVYLEEAKKILEKVNAELQEKLKEKNLQLHTALGMWAHLSSEINNSLMRGTDLFHILSGKLGK